MKNFFLENSAYSMMRLISFITVCAGCLTSIIIIILIFMKYDAAYMHLLINLTGILFGFGFGGKLLQKYGEDKSNA